MCADHAPYAVLLNPGQDYRQIRLTRCIQLAADSESAANWIHRGYYNDI